jgi:hypothetical protein
MSSLEDLLQSLPIRPRPRGSVPSCHPDSTSWVCAPPDIIDECLSGYGLGTDRSNVGALVVEEIRRLHEGVLARHALRLAEFAQWRARQMRMQYRRGARPQNRPAGCPPRSGQDRRSDAIAI